MLREPHRSSYAQDLRSRGGKRLGSVWETVRAWKDLLVWMTWGELQELIQPFITGRIAVSPSLNVTAATSAATAYGEGFHPLSQGRRDRG